MSETLEHTHPNKTDGKDGIAISPAFVSGPNGPVDTEHHASVEPASSTPSPAEFVARIQAQQGTIDPTDEVSPLLRTASGSLARAIPYNVVKQVGSQANVAGLLNPRLMSAIILQQYMRNCGAALSQTMDALGAWIRAHRVQSYAILFGSALIILSLAAPGILGVIGFSATGPVAGSIAAAWQASLGAVAAGSPFAFLQGAAMAGAAAGVFGAVGAVGCGIALAGGLALAKKSVGALAGNAKRMFGRWMGRGD